MSTSRSYLNPDSLPRYPELVEISIPGEGDEEPSTYTEPHPFAGQIDGNALQALIGDGVFVGEGTKWALPWEYGTGPNAIAGTEMTVQTSDVPAIPPIPADPQHTGGGDLVDPAFAGKPLVNARDDMSRALRLIIRYALPGYPSIEEIRTDLTGRVLVDTIPLHEASHADVLAGVADGAQA